MGEKLAVPTAFGLLLTLGVVTGVPALEGVSASIAIVLAFGSAALLYLVTEELLVKAGKVPETPVTTLFFVGFSRSSCWTCCTDPAPERRVPTPGG